jgi:hypothetical protein
MQRFTDVQLFLKDHGRLRQHARQSFGQVHLLNFPCDLLCGGAFSTVHDPSEPVCVQKSGVRPKHAIVQYWFGLINTHPGFGWVQRYYDKFAGIGCARN